MNRDSAVPPFTALRRRTSDESGFALVEAVVAAAVFAVIVLGVLAGIDGAAGSSGREKARSVAGSIAEQDQERMRGMRAVDLSNYSWKRDVPVGNAVYTVQSDSDWIRDNTGGTISCTNSSAQADYLRIRTTVTSSSVGKRTAPVQIDSLVAPPVGAVGSNQGTLAVQVNNRDAVGVASIPVKISNGTTTLTELTNSVGCAVFAYVPIGAYDVNINQPGWVDPNGTNDVHVSGSVSNGTTNVVKIEYDVAGSVTASFRTKYWNAATSAFVDVPVARLLVLARQRRRPERGLPPVHPDARPLRHDRGDPAVPVQGPLRALLRPLPGGEPDGDERRRGAARRPRRHLQRDRLPAGAARPRHAQRRSDPQRPRHAPRSSRAARAPATAWSPAAPARPAA